MVDDLDKLPPEERIKKLKELEKKQKEEIKKAQDLIKKSEEELEEKEEEKRKIPVPLLKSVDIEHLFGGEEKDLFETKRYVKKEKPLEETVVEEKPKLTQEQVEQLQVQYSVQRNTEMDKIYNRVKEVYQQFKETGEVTAKQMGEVVAAAYATRQKRDDIEAGKYTEFSDAINKEMNVTYKMIKMMQDKYKG
jgi:hypothetical protein